MSRQRFGRWAAGLGAGEFAQAIAAAGVFGRSIPLPSAVADEHFHPATGLVIVQEGDINDLIWRIHEPAAVPTAVEYVKAWDLIRLSVKQSGQQLLRLMVEPILSRWPLGMDWLVGQLGHPAVGASSVFVRDERGELAMGWNWPIIVGLLPGPRSAAMRKWLPRKHALSHLFQFSEIEAAGSGECDLLLLDADLRPALAQLLDRSRNVAADCVLILGDAGVPEARAETLAGTFFQEARTLGLAILSTPQNERQEWFLSLIAELSHNNPLDVALWRAAAKVKAPQPFIRASAYLMSHARLAQTAHRMAERIHAMAKPPAGAENQMKIIADSGVFSGETRGATEMVDIKSKVEATAGTRLHFAKKRNGGAPAPQPAPVTEQRRVNFDLYDVTVDPKHGPILKAPLLRDRRYLLELFIGRPREGVGGADKPFPADQLPRSQIGHRLEVMFCPLTRDTDGALAEPQSTPVFLPAQGDTDPFSFEFDTIRTRDQYDARVIISYGNRVMQTLIFSAGMADGTKAAVGLTVESVLSTDLGSQGGRQDVDAALIVNHSPAGTPGVTALADGDITFEELPGIEEVVGRIRGLLKKAASRETAYENLNHQDLRQLFFELAHSGKKIWDQLSPRARKLLGSADILQVTDARPGAYLPVEFMFNGTAPDDPLEICPHAQKCLDEGTPHRECPNHESDAFQCPLRFWGFQRVIERQTVYVDEAKGKFRISTPTAARNKLNAFRSALMGASTNVLAGDVQKIQSLLAEKSANVWLVPGWEPWPKEVKDRTPSLLMLLPHSTKWDKLATEDALEISKQQLPVTKFADGYVAASDSEHPVVLLLGCSTTLPEVAFASFVRYFKQSGAALVIGTLSPIRGRRAVPFVKELLTALSAENTTFGEAFLKVRRKLLATGDPFALTLVSYGDTDWIL
jgi:hypothetical protein